MSVPLTDDIRAKLHDWQSKLIDLSFRNSILNFDARSKFLEIVTEIPSEVFRTLYLDEHPMGFLEQSVQPENLVEIDYQFFHRDPLTSGHHDRALQTSFNKTALNHQLIEIYRNSNEWIEERGINVLFLSLGLLEGSVANIPFRTPLVLLPVELERPDIDSFRLRASGDDPFVNPFFSATCNLNFKLLCLLYRKNSRNLSQKRFC